MSQLTAEEREHLIAALERTGEEFLAASRGLTQEQWTFKPAEDSWSIAECSDHIGSVEKRILGLIRDGGLTEDAERGAAAQGKERLIRKAVPNRETKVKVPPGRPPYGFSATPVEFEEHFRVTRGESVEYARTTQDPLHARVMNHFVFGDFDGAQWLEFLAQHAVRHRKQIEEVKAAAGYPE